VIASVGDDQAGFFIDDLATGNVYVRAWGFWSAEVAQAFGGTVQAACNGKPAGTELVMDMTELKPMREEGQKSFAALMRALPGQGIPITIETASHLTKLQLLRIVTEQGAAGSVRFELGSESR
jgi:hypothetical protein